MIHRGNNTLDGVSNAFYGLLWRFFSNIHQNMPIGRDQGILGDKKNTQVKAYRAFRQGGQRTDLYKKLLNK